MGTGWPSVVVSDAIIRFSDRTGTSTSPMMLCDNTLFVLCGFKSIVLRVMKHPLLGFLVTMLLTSI
jgi:hypothetical protein